MRLLTKKFAPFIYLGNKLFFKKKTVLPASIWSTLTYSLIHCSKGSVILTKNSCTWELSSGHVGLIDPGTAIEVSSHSNLLTISFDCFHRERDFNFPSNRMLNRIPEPSLDDVLNSSYDPIISDQWTATVINLMANIHALYWIDDQHLLIMNSKLHEWITGYFCSIMDKTSFIDRELSLKEQVFILIRQRPSSITSVSDIAAALNMSRSHFTRLYKKQCGYTPTDTLNRERCSMAQLMIRKPKHTLSRVALLMGFDNQSSFSRWFKQSCGLSPSKYKKSMALIPNA